ncbi:MAG: serine hydrolase [Hyphomicrobiaceae bacterium]
MTTDQSVDALFAARDRCPGPEIPRIDWDRPPWNRWTFQNIRQVLPTSEVWRGDGPVCALATDAQDLGAVPFHSTAGGHMTVAGLLDSTFTDGFIVVHRGRIVYERYMNHMTERTLHLSQSVAKSVTAAAAGVLMGRGLLDPEAPVTHYLPELETSAYRGAKVAHVLDMTSGVAFNEDDYGDRYSDIGQMDVASGWKPVPPGADPHFDWPGSVFEQARRLAHLEAEHGSRFRYRSIETDVLAFCMERAAGKRLPQIVSETVWAPMGAAETAAFTVDPTGYALASGGLNATLRDYARFGLLYLNDGRAGERQVLPAAWVADTRSGPHGLANDYLRLSLPEGCYRNQFWVEDRRGETIMARGVFGQLIYIAPAQNMVAVKLSSFPDFLNLQYGLDTLAALHAIAAALA